MLESVYEMLMHAHLFSSFKHCMQESTWEKLAAKKLHSCSSNSAT